jgi:hypothetical protein
MASPISIPRRRPRACFAARGARVESVINELTSTHLFVCGARRARARPTSLERCISMKNGSARRPVSASSLRSSLAFASLWPMRAFHPVHGWFACAGALVCGCVQSEAGPKPPAVFGGVGAQVATLDEKPLPAVDKVPEATGPCGREAPPSDTALLDDFEDGDGTLFKGFEREGY